MNHDRLDDFTWYSRLLVWVGALVLLIESVAGRSAGILTLFAVLALAGGLIAFLGALAFAGRRDAGAMRGDAEVRVESPPVDIAAPPNEREDEPQPVHLGADVRAAEPVTPVPAAVPASRPSIAAREGAVSHEIGPGSTLLSVPCLRCQEPLRENQMAATCAECGGAHHATCWMGNHFQCAREGCGGHGHLEAPGALEGEAAGQPPP